MLGYLTIRLQKGRTDVILFCRWAPNLSGIESRDESQDWTEQMTLTCVNLTGAKVVLTARP
jgi:hypothetical protein